MTTFNCTSCGYSTNKNIITRTCPYCSKPNAMVEEEKIEELVEEA